ncbi:MAG: prepilin-type N-terminal cleavage/methylation domain-containing protein [Akkermansiaceae bacterium]|jgi:prepilin-type N-terminal cleavage/methylation domain-containing protein|nr:prepilin-type N-terminal cleavage/methylation domain-containing protein [Akkermansiaceae bacterium]
MKTQTFRKARRGFTLLELMVAMAITSVIVTVLVTITSVATDTWTRSRSETRAARQAKVMLDAMAKDLESLVSRRGSDSEWLYASISSLNAPKVVSSQSGDTNAAELIFTTAATDRYAGQIGDSFPANVGDVSTAAYRLAYQDPIDGSQNRDTSTFALYRLLVDPDETFDKILGAKDLDTAFNTFSGRLTEEQNFVCENVHQFTVTFLVEVTPAATGSGTAPKPKIVRLTLSSDNSTGEFRLKGTGIETNISTAAATAAEISAGRLTGIELSMSVLSDAGLARMAGGQGLKPEDYARNVYHYSRVVNVPSM